MQPPHPSKRGRPRAPDPLVRFAVRIPTSLRTTLLETLDDVHQGAQPDATLSSLTRTLLRKGLGLPRSPR